MKERSPNANISARRARKETSAKSTVLTYVERLDACLALLNGAYADNTLRAYRADFEAFINWCTVAANCPLPAKPSTVVDFVRYEAERSKSATVRRRLAAISRIHRLSGHDDPTKNETVYLATRRMHRQIGRHQKQAHGLTWTLVEKMLAACGAGSRGRRDRVLLRLAYETLRRRAELVSLQVEDLTIRADGSGSVLLRFSKTDQEGEGKKLLLSKETVAACVEWIDCMGLTNGPILRSVPKGGHPGERLSAASIPRIFQRLARQAGLPATIVRGISGHSTRVGAAQDMLSRGASLAQIMHRGGWKKPETVMRYVELASPDT